MKIVASAGREDIAVVYIADFGAGRMLECVESLQPPLSREQKWVLLVSTMFGCPVGCKMCDAGGGYKGNASAEEIFSQIDWLVYKRYPDGNVPCQQFKIQFARMGEPALNPAVLTVLDELPQRFHAPGLMPSLSTVAPKGAERFLDRLLEIKRLHYQDMRFQFQFSIHTTDEKLRDHLIPVNKWSFQQIAEYGEAFYSPGDLKITLNFALAKGMPIEPQVLRRYFTPEKFLLKVTPLNPTYRAVQNELCSYINPYEKDCLYPALEALRQAGYDVILSIGEVEENFIGSNCGQYLQRHLMGSVEIAGGYTYPLQAYPSLD